MFNKVNDLIDHKQEEIYLEEYLKSIGYYQIRNILGYLFFISISMVIALFLFIFTAEKDLKSEINLYNTKTETVEKIEVNKQPNVNTNNLKGFVNYILQEMYSQNFVDIEQKSALLKKYFTKESWELFSTYLDNEFIPFVKDNKLISKITIVNYPEYTGGFKYITGERVYKYEGEFYITYSGSLLNESNKNQNSIYEMRLVSVDSSVSPYGVLIKELRTKQKKNN